MRHATTKAPCFGPYLLGEATVQAVRVEMHRNNNEQIE